MTKKDFFDLLLKFEKGKCSKEEEELLFKFYESFQQGNIMESWTFSEKEASKLRLLKRIRKTIKHQQQKKKESKIFYFSRVAVTFLLLITTAHLIYDSSNKPIKTIPKNAITLQLEDGSIQIIKKGNPANITDKKGNTLAKQQGSQLTYHNSNTNTKLAYNTLSVPLGQTFQVVLSDGTKVHLNAGSSIKYPVQFLDTMDRVVQISGEGFLDVAKDSLHPFIVKTSHVNVRVLGTQFNVHAYDEDTNSEIVLVEGSVSLYQKNTTYNSKKSNLLEPGYKAIFNKETSNILKNKVYTAVYTSWMNGELVFRNMSFENILKKLERYYNIKIINNNKQLSKEKFNASFGKKPLLKKVLEELKTTYHIDYSIQENTITIN